MSAAEDKIIGSSWAFPPRFNQHEQSAVMVTGADNIAQSLNVLFGTQRGERLLVQEYGCDLSSLIYRPVSASTAATLKNQIERAIVLYEPRIILQKLVIDTSDSINGKVSIRIDWIEEKTNNRRNMVFPFYAAEGTLIPAKS
ncbi:GPW/gp25 family protein [Rubritalea marina]|uniref:GPW/gp25 family protein n=1 Tax=Rubritalea marina TaxID=361055 RepID=UPI00037B842F|nr:GPW/gp25 family protein [Rubritalea marina]